MNVTPQPVVCFSPYPEEAGSFPFAPVVLPSSPLVGSSASCTLLDPEGNYLEGYPNLTIDTLPIVLGSLAPEATYEIITIPGCSFLSSTLGCLFRVGDVLFQVRGANSIGTDEQVNGYPIYEDLMRETPPD